MLCNEIQERFIDLLYCEEGALLPSHELQEHIRSCPACSKELEELKQTRNILGRWKDEPPLRKITIGRQDDFGRHLRWNWSYLRYAAVAAMALIAFLALANTRITWRQNEFSFSTHLLPDRDATKDYYSKSEARNIIKQALDDSEYRITETNLLMIKKLLDTVEQDRWTDLSYTQRHSASNRNKN